MPKGQGPASNMEARYQSLDAQLNRAKAEFDGSLLRKLRRKLDQLGGKQSPNAGVSTVQQRSLLKKLEKIETNMIRQGAMKDKVEKAMTP